MAGFKGERRAWDAGGGGGGRAVPRDPHGRSELGGGAGKSR